MYQLGIVKRNIVRADRAAVDKLAALRRGHRPRGHGPRRPDEALHAADLCRRAAWPARRSPCCCSPGDNWMMHVAAEQMQPGDVVVAACTAENTDGFFGDLLATSFRARGAKGLVIDGGCRDVKDLTAMGSRCGAAPSAPRARSRPRSARSTCRVVCAGAEVNPGDVVVADDDGVVVVPAAMAHAGGRRRRRARGQRGREARQAGRRRARPGHVQHARARSRRPG